MLGLEGNKEDPMVKFKSANRDGFHWLTVVLESGRQIWLHRMARLGDTHVDGQRYREGIGG